MLAGHFCKAVEGEPWVLIGAFLNPGSEFTSTSLVNRTSGGIEGSAVGSGKWAGLSRVGVEDASRGAAKKAV